MPYDGPTGSMVPACVRIESVVSGSRSGVLCEYAIDLGFSRLTVKGEWIGGDLLITVSGGELPHIGTVVMACPRPSLTGDGTMSATSSVMNVVGHKDEEICRYLAQSAAARHSAVTVCLGGFHVDAMTAEQITDLMQAVRSLTI